MKRVLRVLQSTADNIAAAMLAAMFVVFLVQIISRYFFNMPLAWTEEVCITLWLWLVFWASAFCLKEKDHIKFDVLYSVSPRKAQRIMALIAALGIAGAMAYSFLPTWDYISFYKIKKSANLRIRLNYVFSIYGLFIAVIVIRYSWSALTQVFPRLHSLFNDESPS
ncbi:TRAP transporter small permease [Marinomonas mediterranea]|uniref:TRAP transporter small permease n=1 Tax=Marinomonas mediterranea TaxID=119864 RepID=UPI00234A3964|nr:TRAP transporter small permease subunit [Marinomonas mediterranea]WCN08737.1 TRAP transporter small permease subunit [Marinomonas mediterranea]